MSTTSENILPEGNHGSNETITLEPSGGISSKDEKQENDLPESRIRTLTEKGEALYVASQFRFKSQMDAAWDHVTINMSYCDDCPKDLNALNKGKTLLEESYSKFVHFSEAYINFLGRTKTLESQNELEKHTFDMTQCRGVYDCAITKFEKNIQSAIDTASIRSSEKTRKSVASSHNSISSQIARKLAKAEAAKAGVKFAEKEASILKQQAAADEEQLLIAAKATRKKAELEAELRLLQQQKEVALAEAEVSALQAVSEKSEHSIQISLPAVDPIERTKAYVADHKQDLIGEDDGNHKLNPTEKPTPKHQFTDCPPQQLNVNATPFNPNAATAFSTFLLRKDLLMSRLRNFNDQPESYGIWKAGFTSVMDELQVSASEELDLLVKWLGHDSYRHALSLRAANIHDPQRGLNRVWERLDERYGSPEVVEAALKTRLANFPRLTGKDNKKLYDLADLLSEIEAVKQNETYRALLSYFDTSSGVIPIVSKLPYGLQEKWTTTAFKYKERYQVPFPPFSVFVDFIREVSKIKNDPSFNYETPSSLSTRRDRYHEPIKPSTVHSRKTQMQEPQTENRETAGRCPLHHTRHELNDCKGFREMSYEDKKDFLHKNRICYRCCSSTQHIAMECKKPIKCGVCGSTTHVAALHMVNAERREFRKPAKDYGGENYKTANGSIATKCTEVCGDSFRGKSCAKTLLVNVYPKGQPEKAKRVYAMLDDQSNVSLARDTLFVHFNFGAERIRYSLSSCAGIIDSSGRRAEGLIVKSIDSSICLDLPPLVECRQIPNNREEITPEVARCYPHFADIVDMIPPIDDSAHIELLIGRDLVKVHHVLDQRMGEGNTPYAQKLCLGWVIIGETCLGKVHQPHRVTVNKTYLLRDGRSSIFGQCPNNFNLKQSYCESDPGLASFQVEQERMSVFDTTQEDEKIGLSVEDREFLQIMEKSMHRAPEGNWVAPLPFRSARPILPNNRPQAVKRAKTLDHSLKRNSVKRQHMVDFMQKIIDNKHAETAPPLKSGEECWYLPLFGVYHPKKPDQVRVVFDSSAQHEGISLNNVLLQGPDLTNSLLGILIRFRQEPIAIMGDIQQMFHCFHVREDHRNYLRFLWYRDNNPDNDLIDYRMCVHVFGNSPSPAIATFGLRKAAETAKEHYGEDVSDFVENNFYVDDGLTSLPTADEAVDLMLRTQRALQTYGNLRLHKISSNSASVLEAFPSDDRAKDLKVLNFESEQYPLQRSLGMAWDINSDSFTFRVSQEDKPFTKRGVLSTINSLFDPLGIAAPVIIQGKVMLRDLISTKLDWDEPLPAEHQEQWDRWKNSLQHLQNLNLPRVYISNSFKTAMNKEIHVYCDASEKAIATVAYLRNGRDESYDTGFILGKAKVAPSHGHTIPRLELCAAVLGVNVGSLVASNLKIPSDQIHYYSDSRIVLGYLYNDTKRFSVYVSNRVCHIRKLSNKEQWHYVPTECNPADQGTRSVPASSLGNSDWLKGPPKPKSDESRPNLSELEQDYMPELDVATTQTMVKASLLGSHRFSRFSSWFRLIRTIARLQQFIQRWKDETLRCDRVNAKSCASAETWVIHQVQMELYSKELRALKAKSDMPKDSPIRNLSPTLDDQGLIRVGGRLKYAEIDSNRQNPIILSAKQHISVLLVRHYHESIQHQGRHITEGALREAGFWITGGKRLINSVIHNCVKCRKLRGRTEHQKMSHLPPDRVTPAPPFTFVGIDTFGPWTIVSRKTRGGIANSKRWALMFSCLVTRAVHIEVIESMSSSSFINALRRFISLRGKVKQFRSNRGTNFIGATDSVRSDAVNIDDKNFQRFLTINGTEWIFNAPHSSHMGGSWERMIDLTRRVLESIMSDKTVGELTHEVLTTFMAEVSAIINGRPIVPVSSDPENPFVLTPATLLTQKTDHVACEIDQLDVGDMYKAQWKRVQVLSDIFWCRWKNEYLHTLQTRRKWQEDCPNISVGDFALLKEKNICRNAWPVAVVEDCIVSADSHVRKVVVRVMLHGKPTLYTRPISEMVVLMSLGKDD